MHLGGIVRSRHWIVTEHILGKTQSKIRFEVLEIMYPPPLISNYLGIKEGVHDLQIFVEDILQGKSEDPPGSYPLRLTLHRKFIAPAVFFVGHISAPWSLRCTGIGGNKSYADKLIVVNIVILFLIFFDLCKLRFIG